MSWHRRRRTLPDELEPESFTMTPMIDIVFQLIIFFMLVTEMSDRQIEDLTIPAASMAVRVKERELVLNIMKDGRVRIQGRTFSDTALEDLFEVRKLNPRHANMPLLIRADRSVPFEKVQKVMMIASTHGQVTRLNFGARKE